MASAEYYDGKEMESNLILHRHLINILKFDSIEVRGCVTTKGDVVAIRNNLEVPISIKHSSQKNTQVHLPTLRSFAKSMSISSDVTGLLEQWLGVTDQSKFESWLNGRTPTKSQQKYKRLYADDISEWNTVVDWFNTNTNAVAKLLVASMNNEQPAEYLVWVKKNKNIFQIIDIPKLIEWINTDCKWITGPRNGGSTLRCQDSSGKPIFHLQMKGSGGSNGEYNHNPQFHIHSHWPSAAIIYEGKLTS